MDDVGASESLKGFAKVRKGEFVILGKPLGIPEQERGGNFISRMGIAEDKTQRVQLERDRRGEEWATFIRKNIRPSSWGGENAVGANTIAYRNGKLVVTRTTDGGASFEALTNGLPQAHAYDLIFRHGLTIDEEGSALAFGSTTDKVIWGDDWDPLLAADRDGALVKRMEEVTDGQYQKYTVSGGAFFRKDFFGKYPKVLELVENYSDEQLGRMRRGGHDPEMVRAGITARFAEQPPSANGDKSFELTLINTGAAHLLPTGTPDRHLSVHLRMLNRQGEVVDEKTHLLQRTTLWRPFIIDLWDTRLVRMQPRYFDLTVNSGKATQVHAVEAEVRYHLLAEERRRRIGYQNREPIDY